LIDKNLKIAARQFSTGTKFGGGGKARAGKNSFPPTPFLFARPSENYQNSASGFSRKKVRILFKTDSQFVKFWFPVLAFRRRRISYFAS
jgi:hypothetical protein